VWQETVMFPLLQCPELVALPSQQGSVSAAPKAHFRIGTWIAQRTKLCPLSSSPDSTISKGTDVVKYIYLVLGQEIMPQFVSS